MRNIININDNWLFSKNNADFEKVNIPHTWNNFDGQDGGSDYLRQKCYYKKVLNLLSLNGKQKVFLEFQGVNHIANVTFNGIHLGEHRGGFSTFRYNITNLIIDGENTIEVEVDNSPDLPVYPQQADFTFFGGIYRDVNIIEVGNTHFDLEFFGSTGVYITPKLVGVNAEISVLSYLKGYFYNTQVKINVLDKDNKVVTTVSTPAKKELTQTIYLENINLWNGCSSEDGAYLYSLQIQIIKDDTLLEDTLTIPFGIRDFEVDVDKGFILNGEQYPLHGVSRHQDKQDKGWAISKQDQDLDIELIKEIGANTIRLAHYQHNQYFYDLCDQEGMVVWAEIPFITVFLDNPDAIENTKTQMCELVLQNYNHPSICFWGISNEITIAGESDALVENQKALVEIIKKYDNTRLTTLANVSFVEMQSEQNNLTDIVGYNHYFGWYMGDLEDNEKWIDEFHEKYPNRPLAITEYGAEGIVTLHTETPACKDYTEEYHATYHEHMLKIFQTRHFLWGTYQWNMFDFACDGRDEGGVAGRNNKGLVSFDRKTKKDAFYLYKAYWNETEKFVHLCGRRFVDRDLEETTIKAYSNENEVTLLVNGVEVEKQTSGKVFVFKNVKLKKGENTIRAVTTNNTDEITLKLVDEPNPSYVLPKEENDGGERAKNWFLDLQYEIKSNDELTFNEGYFSVKDTIEEILSHSQAGVVLRDLMEAVASSGAKINDGMMKMLGKMPLEVVFKMAGRKLPDGSKILINTKLQSIMK